MKYEYAKFYHKNLSNYHNNTNLYNYKARKLYEKYFGIPTVIWKYTMGCLFWLNNDLIWSH